MKKILIYVILCIMLSSSVLAVETCFQWDATNGTDATIKSGASASNFNGEKEYTGWDSVEGDSRWLINFINTTKSIPSGSTIDEVSLQWYNDRTFGTQAVVVYPVNKTWGETDVTWDGIGTGYYNSSYVIAVIPSSVWTAAQDNYYSYHLNTSWYQKLLDDGGSWAFSKGIVFKYNTTGSGDNEAQPHHSDSATANYRPKLCVNWTAGVGESIITTLISPTNGDNDNSLNQSFTYNVTPFVDNCSLWINSTGTFHLNQTNSTIVANQTETFSLDLPSEGNYVWNVQCYNGSSFDFGDSNFTLTIDITSPTITLNIPNGFNTSNVSTINQYANYLNFNITTTDDNDLFAFSINVTKDGVSVFNFTNSSLSGSTSYTYTSNQTTTNWTDGFYNIEISASDSHTKNKIKDYDVNRLLGKISFDTAEGSSISISGEGAYWTDYEKKIDRYEYEFSYLTSKDSRKYTLKADSKLYYLPNSGYKGHFVTKTNWVDFEGIGGDIKVTKISDYEYEIEFKNMKSNNKVKFKSIGGLNINTVNYKWFKGSTTLIAPNGFSAGTSTLSLNITKNSTHIPTITATLNYNNTEQTVSSTEYTDYYIFSSSVTAPTISSDVNISYSWEIMINQSNSNQYNFTETANHSVFDWGIDNCSSYSTRALNVSFIEFETDNPININYEYNVLFNRSTSMGNYSNSGYGNETFLCIYPSNITLTADIFYQWINNSVLYTYYGDDTELNNVTKSWLLRVTGGTTDVTATVYGSTNEPLESAYINYMKYDVSSNSYKLVGIGKTNFEGDVKIPLVRDTEFYKFLIYYPYGTLRRETIPTYIYENTIIFQINTGDDIAEDFYKVRDVDYSIVFNNGTDSFRYTFSDPNLEITQGCLYIYKTTVLGGTTTIASTCVSGTSGTILETITPENGTTFTAEGQVTLSGNDWIAGSTTQSYSPTDAPPDNLMGLVIVFVLTIIFAFTFKYSIELGIAVLPLPFLLCSIAGIIDIPLPVPAGLQIAAIVLSLILNKVID